MYLLELMQLVAHRPWTMFHCWNLAVWHMVSDGKSGEYSAGPNNYLEERESYIMVQ